MRHFATFLVLLSICPEVLLAQASRGAPPPTIARRPVTRNSAPALAPLQLEDQWTTALVNRDARAFDRLLAPNFVYTENSAVMNRGDVIKSVTGPDKVQWARNEGMKLHDFGDVQVVTGGLHLRGRDEKGRAFERRYQFTDTWQQRDGRWQIVAAQDYLIPK